MKRNKLFLIALMGIMPFLSACSAKEGTGSVVTSNYANRRLGYYYYIPGNLDSRTVPFLICVPWLSGMGQDFVTDEMKRFTHIHGVALIAPSFQFDEQNWNNRSSYQFPAVWSGDALLAILDQVSQNHSLKCTGLYLMGTSAGAQFSLRFPLWKPDQCIGCASYGSGSFIEPAKDSKVKYFIGIGNKDTRRIGFAESFRDSALSNGIKLTYKVYDSDHDTPDQFFRDSLEFFGSIISD